MTSKHHNAAKMLSGYIEKIERLEEEKKELADDIKDVYGEAKSAGFDTSIMREVIKLRRQDRTERENRRQLLDEYLEALETETQEDER